MSAQRTCEIEGCEKPYKRTGYCAMHAERVRRSGTVDLVGRRRKPMSDRLAAKVDTSAGPDGCWPFTGKVGSVGYGRIRVGVAGSRMIGAHRAAFLIANPGVPEPEVIDHACHDPLVCHLGDACPHRRCCNPAHLVASSVAENSAADRQFRPRRELTHCKNGHEFDDANTYWWTDKKGRPGRTCRKCGADRARSRLKKAA